MKITVERCDVFLVGVPQIFDRVKSVALWSVKKKKFSNKTIKGYGSAANSVVTECVLISLRLGFRRNFLSVLTQESEVLSIIRLVRDSSVVRRQRNLGL